VKSFAIRTFLVAAGVATLAACGSSSGGTGTTSGAAGGGSAAATGSPSSSAPAELKTASSSFGQIVVDAQGRTVYFFGKDAANSGKSACGSNGGCIGLWPAVTTTSASPSVNGVTGQVGTITRDDGSKQLTLNGLPVYTFSGDSKAGDTNGQNYMNLWWVVSPSGNKITGSGAASSSASTIPGY
jgi:predicted lipoprotein with Yx(FWY)xxD motif